jgi:hypothetical protein
MFTRAEGSSYYARRANIFPFSIQQNTGHHHAVLVSRSSMLPGQQSKEVSLAWTPSHLLSLLFLYVLEPQNRLRGRARRFSILILLAVRIVFVSRSEGRQRSVTKVPTESGVFPRNKIPVLTEFHSSSSTLSLFQCTRSRFVGKSL